MIGFAVLVVATLLLLSMGGAIVAAPLTLPALFLAARRHPSRPFRIAAAVVGGLTAAEVAWAAVYVTVGERPIAVWLVPLVVGTAAGVLYLAAPQF